MTPPSQGIVTPPAGAPPASGPPMPAAPPAKRGRTDLVVRLLVTLALVVAYYHYRDAAVPWLQQAWTRLTGLATQPATVGVWLVAAVLAALVYLWRGTLARDKRFYAPLLITSILVVGDAAFGILESHYSPTLAWLTGGRLARYSPTFVVMLTTVLAEMLLGRFYYGKWPHLASAYISGISAGILIKSNLLWPFVMCGLISITSKYVLRVGDRHLWNPTNFGVTAMLFLAPQYVASLSVEAGNEIWAAVVIWILGGMILYSLGRLHIPAAVVLAFIPLSYLPSLLSG